MTQSDNLLDDGLAEILEKYSDIIKLTTAQSLLGVNAELIKLPDDLTLYQALKRFVEQREQAARRSELERLLEWNGAYIGIDGKRVDNMVHHRVIEERLEELKDA